MWAGSKRAICRTISDPMDPPAPRHQDSASCHILTNQTRLQLNRITPQQVFQVDRTNLRNRDRSADQVVDGRQDPILKIRFARLIDDSADRIAVGRRHRDQDLVRPTGASRCGQAVERSDHRHTRDSGTQLRLVVVDEADGNQAFLGVAAHLRAIMLPDSPAPAISTWRRRPSEAASRLLNRSFSNRIVTRAMLIPATADSASMSGTLRGSESVSTGSQTE